VAAEPVIEVLWWAGCPSYPEALADLRAAVGDLGGAPGAVVSRELRTDDEADEERFAGSPTIRVDGRDLFPQPDEPTGLTCRVYRLRDGRSSPTPDPDDLRDALRAALKEA
jgi:hypothetical protein